MYKVADMTSVHWSMCEVGMIHHWVSCVYKVADTTSVHWSMCEVRLTQGMIHHCESELALQEYSFSIQN